MTELVVDSGIDSEADLLALMPHQVAPVVKPYLLALANNAAVLRVLAAVPVSRADWRDAVGLTQINAGHLLSLAHNPVIPERDRLLIRGALAISGAVGVHVDLNEVLRGLDDEEDFLLLVDAMRIAREGLES